MTEYYGGEKMNGKVIGEEHKTLKEIKVDVRKLGLQQLLLYHWANCSKTSKEQSLDSALLILYKEWIFGLYYNLVDLHQDLTNHGLEVKISISQGVFIWLPDWNWP